MLQLSSVFRLIQYFIDAKPAHSTGDRPLDFLIYAAAKECHAQGASTLI